MIHFQARTGGHWACLVRVIESHDCNLDAYICVPCLPSMCAVNPHHVWWSGACCDKALSVARISPSSGLVMKADATYSFTCGYDEMWGSFNDQCYPAYYEPTSWNSDQRAILARVQVLTLDAFYTTTRLLVTTPAKALAFVRGCQKQTIAS